MAEDCDDSEGKEIARRRRREETRDRDGRGNRLSSNDWPSRVSRKNGEPHSRLQGDASVRGAMEKSVKAYDMGLVAKLNGGAKSEPSNRNYFTQPQNYRPLSYTTPTPEEFPPSPLGLWRSSKEFIKSRTSNPIPIPSPGSQTPIERWAQADGIPPPLGLAEPVPGQPSFSPAFTEIRNSGDNASVSSYVTDNDAHSNGDARMRRSMSASLLGQGFDDSGIASSMQSRNSCDPYEDSDYQMDEAPYHHVYQMKRLTIQDARTPPKSNSYPSQVNHQRVGSKRRASSPPNEDTMNSEPTRKGVLLESVGSEIYDRSRRTSPIHQGGARNSPGGPSKCRASSGIFSSQVPRSASGSFASAAASSLTWSSSVGLSSLASSITTVDRGTPATSYTPSIDMEIIDAPFRQSQITLAANRPNNRQRTGSETTITATGAEKDTVAVKHLSAPKMAGAFICECCPKKPKKFETYEDLQLHETEKQYSCQYCSNRFKNKNEAERHQNSLHLRKHSWSCAALCGYEAAFHQSPQRPNAEICGYCGKEFPSPPQWDARVEHLTTEHKFGECNQSKKFYRADHFRQHLKHSHSGTSGKWTNVLENACMRDEIPPATGSLGLGTCATSAISEEGSD
ncbi:uncharacterized protein LAJ45_05416 [Morchella importuna]|uniref:uncharacterized protein n=1 Tax=Morchella importuna TaxID=1174673 RepID=UPI001E8DAB39|nr:uncharacterized protein LAJ45_05416 [Morchella importuna]KAH8150720.1 hypothetical protein LAJ45_05416 [Morchella importuna]